MNVTIKPAPIRKSLVVQAPQERAFEVFTAGMGRWWVKTNTILPSSPQKTVVVEPRIGGRWYEIGEDGSEAEWGKVLVWSPPSRLVLTWQVDGDWQFNPKVLTEVEVRFVAEGQATRVELEHRKLETFGEAADTLREVFDAPSGWTGTLAACAALIASRG
jgi:uncharacterized protein YndB with AHSA1/START domain